MSVLLDGLWIMFAVFFWYVCMDSEEHILMLCQHLLFVGQLLNAHTTGGAGEINGLPYW
jgi:hypothetical protein